MYFVIGKNGVDTRKKVRGAVIHAPKLSDDVDANFCHNPSGDALFSARFVAALAGMNNYLFRTAPRGGGKKSLSQNGYING
jgi:hypothetical protein